MSGTRLAIASALLLVAMIAVPGVQGQEETDFAGKKISSVEERRILTSLQEERTRLQQRGLELDKRETELKKLQAEVDKKLGELKTRREELAVMLAQRSEEELKKIGELSKMYEKMDTDKAAQVIATLEKDLATEILGGMRAKSAGKILGAMEQDQASDLTVSYSSLEK